MKFIKDPDEMSDFDYRLYETSKFVLKLLIAGFLFRLVLFLNPTTYQVQAAFTSLIGYLLSITGVEVIHEGIRIFTDNATYVIVQDCLGWKSMAVFLGLMWASTKRTLEHLNYILLGLGILLIGNIVRVFSTVYLAEIGVFSFDIIHDVLWRWSLTILVLGIWAFWLRNRKEEKKFDKRIKEQVRKFN
ncbi:MAG: exosortase/archaeosortase family protein [Candidatus Nanohaloarchaea archaeon]